MKRYLCILLLPFMISIFVMAESDKSRINSVKKNGAYLYGEANLLTKYEAVRLASDLLRNEIKKWQSENNYNNLDVQEAIFQQFVDTIVIERTNRTRAFVYVKTSDLASSLKSVKKEPSTQEQQTTISNQKQEQNEQRVIEKAKPSVSSTPSIERQTAPNTVVASGNRASQTPASNGDSHSVLTRLKNIDSFYDLKNVIEPLYENGQIKAYGKYSSMQNPAECYLIIYDSNGYIKALLGKGVSERQNLNTQQIDSEHNYPGCGAIWFKL